MFTVSVSFETFRITFQTCVLQVQFLDAKQEKDLMVVIHQMVNADAELQRHALDLCQYVVIQTLHLHFALAIQEAMEHHLHVASQIQHVEQTEFVL